MFTKSQVEHLLNRIYDEIHERPDALRREEFVFHMVDWLKDLERLVQLFSAPAVPEKDLHEASLMMIGFLAHVPPHLMSASRVMSGSLPKALPRFKR